MFFSVDTTCVVSELQKRTELRGFAKLGKIPEVEEILSSICARGGRNRVLIVDNTRLWY